jgi:fatty acid desaturase
MWVKHDLALLNLTVLLEETSHLSLRQTWVDAGDEQVRAWVNSAIILWWWTTVVLWATWWSHVSVGGIVVSRVAGCIPRVVTITRGRRAATRAIVAAWAWGGAALTLVVVTWSLVWIGAVVRFGRTVVS